MMLANAYSSELSYWKNMDSDYVSLGHQNLNVDNAYFWRDDRDKLDCGLVDFGGFAVSNMCHKIWWLLNMADFDQVSSDHPDPDPNPHLLDVLKPRCCCCCLGSLGAEIPNRRCRRVKLVERT